MFHRTQNVAAVLAAALLLGGCATLTEDTHTPVTLTFSNGENGSCKLTNKRGAWETPVPVTVSIRKSDDALKYDCKTDGGKTAFGSIPSEMGGKIVASAVFLDFGITDAITDKHRRYPANFVIVVPTKNQDTRSIPAAKQ
ncbi:MAG: hypothetical protein OXU62_00805 [Gammaproteobacteria bacterium]|nr:hypothetical protein [Gammaproteobacteria bacterium]